MSRRFGQSLLGRIGLGALVLAMGCLTYDRISVTLESNPPLPADATESLVEVTEGVAILLEVEAFTNTDERYAGGEVELEADDASVAIVARGARGREFVVVGLRPGRTCARIVINGRSEGCDLPIIVEAQVR